jgi:hypothetical protein
MAGDKAVENLPEVVTAGLSGTDWLHVIQGVNSRKTSLGSLYDWIVGFLGGGGGGGGGGSTVFFNVKDYGATGDGVTNDSAAFVAAIAAAKAAAVNDVIGFYKASTRVYVPPGHYYMGTTTLEITHTFIFEGDGSGLGGASYPAKLRWAANTTGIRVQRYNTSGAGTTDGVTHYGGDCTVIRGLHLVGAWTSTEGEYHGIHAKARVSVEYSRVEKFQGDGIYSNASAGVGGSGEGNANISRVFGCSFLNNRNNLYLDGADTNIWLVMGNDFQSARQWNDWDSSFLGNNHFSNHADTGGMVDGSTPCIAVQGGNRYCVKKGQEAGASTNAPSGTTADNTWWYYMGAGGISTTFNMRAWVSGTTYRSGGSYRGDGEGNAGNLFSGCYHEGGQPFAQIDPPALVSGGSMRPFVKGVACLYGGTQIASDGGFVAAKNLTAFGNTHQLGPQSGAAIDTNLELFNTGTSSLLNFWRIIAGVPTYEGFVGMIAGTAYLTGIGGVHLRVNNVETANITSTGIDLVTGKKLSVNGTQVVTARQTGCPAAATDLATALTLVNFLRTSGITHGLIS